MNSRICLTVILFSSLTSSALADPCGMVPPILAGPETQIERIGLQKTYVFYRRGLETIVLRPGFKGNVEDFGMLIPFPSPPAIRKVSEDVFPHVAAAIDPPPVPVYLGFGQFGNQGFGQQGFGGFFGGPGPQEQDLKVLKEEAVGMYEVAVLEAGNAQALKRWMTTHGYRYPEGMDHVCEEYIAENWCFVAVKIRVGVKREIDPEPGMRRTDNNLPEGSVFDGHVQAMGFRFYSPSLVVPMRLSAFNAGELRNVVYLLGEAPASIPFFPKTFVRRQIPGSVLLRNITEPLPVEVFGAKPGLKGQEKQFIQSLNSIKDQRDPATVNGAARELFASDLAAWENKVLSHPFEEHEKALLKINEHLMLRGSEIDELTHAVVQTEQQDAMEKSLKQLPEMTLTVIDGDFPREQLSKLNLRFVPYRMDPERNTAQYYNATLAAPGGKSQGILWREVSKSNSHNVNDSSDEVAEGPFDKPLENVQTFNPSLLPDESFTWMNPVAWVGMCFLVVMISLRIRKGSQ